MRHFASRFNGVGLGLGRSNQGEPGFQLLNSNGDAIVRLLMGTSVTIAPVGDPAAHRALEGQDLRVLVNGVQVGTILAADYIAGTPYSITGYATGDILQLVRTNGTTTLATLNITLAKQVTLGSLHFGNGLGRVTEMSEHAPVDTYIGRLYGWNGGSTFELVDSDEGRFRLANRIYLYTNSINFDFEARSSHTFKIAEINQDATNSGRVTTFTVNLLDVPEWTISDGVIRDWPVVTAPSLETGYELFRV